MVAPGGGSARGDQELVLGHRSDRRGGRGDPDGAGCPWRDVLAAVETAATAIRLRFGALGLLGAVTAGRVAVAASGGRLLAPGWPPPRGWAAATRIAPDAGIG
nr:hypothetical protein [Mycobacterium riyadhense]